MTEHQPFIAKILANPTDDGPREVYADWLEEHGECERSEFIRVQLELANIEGPPFVGCHGYAIHMREGEQCQRCGECKQYSTLRRRERELFQEDDSRTLQWFGLPQPWARVVRLERFDSESMSYYPYAIARRGFVDEITCSWADWGGGVCRCVTPFSGSEMPSEFCNFCSGSGRVPGHAAAILAAQPIRRVRLTTWPTGEFANWVIARGQPVYLFDKWPGIEFPRSEFMPFPVAIDAGAMRRLVDARLVGRGHR